MQLKSALIDVALDLDLISFEEWLDLWRDLRWLSAQEVAARVNIGPLPDDHPELLATIDREIAYNQAAVADYLSGKEKAINRVMGQVMRVSGGRNDAESVLLAVRRRIEPTADIEREDISLAKTCSNWIIGDLTAKMNGSDFEFQTDPRMVSRGVRAGCPLPPEELAGLIMLVRTGCLSHSLAHQRVFPRMWEIAVEMRDAEDRRPDGGG